MRWLSLLAPGLLAVFVVAAVKADPGAGLSGRGLVISLAAAAFVIAVFGRNGTARQPPSAAHIGFVAVLLASSIVLMCVQPKGPGAEAVLLGVLCVARVLPRRAAVPVLVVAFVALQVIAGVANQGFGNLAVLAAFAGFYGMLFLAYRLGESNKQAEALLIELKESQDAQARATGLAERQRLAREMHDVLAHSLSGMMLQLEGARMLLAEDPDDPRLPQAINRAHHLGKSGLDEARRAIGMLRDDELPGPELLAGLAAQFQQDRNIPCRLTVSGAENPLGSEARLAVYRVAQEALTNITKHAQPDRVELHLAYEPGATRLTVEDFGPAKGTRQVLAADSGGYGLTGMRERAELLGGTLTNESTRNGFRVELEVPT